MISGGLSTGIDFPPKMLSLSLGSSVIGGSLSDREPPPVLAVATPAQHSQVIMTDEGVVRELERLLHKKDPAWRHLHLRWLDSCPPLGGGGQHSPLIPTRSRIYLQDVCTYSDLVAFFSQIPALPSDGNFDK